MSIRSALLSVAVAVAVPLSLSAACRLPSFDFTNNASGVPAGSVPSSVAIGDFDGDGLPDLAWSDYSHSTVTVVWNNGSHTDVPASIYLVHPTEVAVVPDISGDGVSDLAVVCPNAVIIYSYQAGAFTSAGGLTGASNNFSGVASGKLDSCGNNTIVVADFNGGVVGPGFGAPTTIEPGTSTFDVALADLNHDGKLDLIATDYANNRVLAWEGKGDGTFVTTDFSVSATVGTHPRRLAIADFNHDDRPDIAVTTGRGLEVLAGSGTGLGYTVAAPVTVATASSAWAVAAADFNGDGRPDLAFTDTTTNELKVVLGRGNGTFGPATPFSVGANPMGLAAAPLADRSTVSTVYNDALPEVFVASYGGGVVNAGINDCAEVGADANGDGQVTIADVFYIINYLFQGGPAPAR